MYTRAVASGAWALVRKAWALVRKAWALVRKARALVRKARALVRKARAGVLRVRPLPPAWVACPSLATKCTSALPRARALGGRSSGLATAQLTVLSQRTVASPDAMYMDSLV